MTSDTIVCIKCVDYNKTEQKAIMKHGWMYCRAGYDAHLKFNHVLYINLQLNMTSFRESGECLTYIFAYQNQTVLFCIENEIDRKNCFH